jgi:hypothetical protein
VVGGGVIPPSFASPVSQFLVLRSLSRSVTAPLSARSHFGVGVVPVAVVLVAVVLVAVIFAY